MEKQRREDIGPHLLWKGSKQRFSPFLPLTASSRATFIPRIAPTSHWVVAAGAASPGPLGPGAQAGEGLPFLPSDSSLRC